MRVNSKISAILIALLFLLTATAAQACRSPLSQHRVFLDALAAPMMEQPLIAHVEILETIDPATGDMPHEKLQYGMFVRAKVLKDINDSIKSEEIVIFSPTRSSCSVETRSPEAGHKAYIAGHYIESTNYFYGEWRLAHDPVSMLPF